MQSSLIKFVLMLAFVIVGLSQRAGAVDPLTPRSGVDSSGFDTKVRPQDDFFRYVNGGWINRTEIPADKAIFGTGSQLRDKSESNLRAIIEDLAKADSPAGSEAKKIGDLYASFMDEARADQLGLKPIEADLARIEAISDKTSFLKNLAEFQREGMQGLFGLFVTSDAKQSDHNILYLNQGGISLPDEAYYRDPKFQPIRDKYVAHVAKIFELAGIADPQAAAARVMVVETELAKNHWDRVKSRDRTLTYNKLSSQGT